MIAINLDMYIKLDFLSYLTDKFPLLPLACTDVSKSAPERICIMNISLCIIIVLPYSLPTLIKVNITTFFLMYFLMLWFYPQEALAYKPYMSY